MLFFAEEAKKLQDERDAWQFFDSSLKVPLDDVASLPPALAGQKAAYSALSQEQKTHLSTVFVPLLLARKDKLAGIIEGLGTLNANNWLRVMCALANFDTRRMNPMDCCVSISSTIHKRSQRAQFSL